MGALYDGNRINDIDLRCGVGDVRSGAQGASVRHGRREHGVAGVIPYREEVGVGCGNRTSESGHAAALAAAAPCGVDPEIVRDLRSDEVGMPYSKELGSIPSAGDDAGGVGPAA